MPLINEIKSGEETEDHISSSGSEFVDATEIHEDSTSIDDNNIKI
jgi:hypothetical protein